MRLSNSPSCSVSPLTNERICCYDIQILMAATLADATLADRRDSEEEVIRQMQMRHQKRVAAMASANSLKRRPDPTST